MARVNGDGQLVQINRDDMQRVRDLLYGYRNGAERAAQRAINKGGHAGRKAIVDGIYAKAALKKKDIRSRATFYQASLGTLGQASYKLVLKSGPLNLLEFYSAKPAAGKKGGVSFRIWRDGKREKYRHAFIATLIQSRYSGVFEENVDSPKYDKEKGIPWRRKEGPGIPMIYEKTPGLAAKAHERAMEVMMAELDRQIGLINKGFYD
ncbi:hypothetical protein [Marinobacterium litorale]|uniref:hypothetical protein n=1 Tax=Marinobacterium litorale TaxID=404770 RepID=UPI0004093501|nr:hypothetical protein [Marinobacterium litorale]